MQSEILVAGFAHIYITKGISIFFSLNKMMKNKLRGP